MPEPIVSMCPLEHGHLGNPEVSVFSPGKGGVDLVCR